MRADKFGSRDPDHPALRAGPQFQGSDVVQEMHGDERSTSTECGVRPVEDRRIWLFHDAVRFADGIVEVNNYLLDF